MSEMYDTSTERQEQYLRGEFETEADYQEALNNIPADNCGDVKPSKELLQYFRRNK